MNKYTAVEIITTKYEATLFFISELMSKEE